MTISTTLTNFVNDVGGPFAILIAALLYSVAACISVVALFQLWDSTMKGSASQYNKVTAAWSFVIGGLMFSFATFLAYAGVSFFGQDGATTYAVATFLANAGGDAYQEFSAQFLAVQRIFQLVGIYGVAMSLITVHAHNQGRQNASKREAGGFFVGGVLLWNIGFYLDAVDRSFGLGWFS